MKRYSNQIRVIDVRDISKITFRDFDVKFTISVNNLSRDVGNSIGIGTNSLHRGAAVFNLGSNANRYVNFNANNVVKNININEDENGPGNGSNYEVFENNFIFFENPEAVKELNFTGAKGDNSVSAFEINKSLKNLQKIKAQRAILPHFKFLEFTQQIKSIEWALNTNPPTGVSHLKDSGVVWLKFSGYNTLGGSNFLYALPNDLYYFNFNYISSLATHSINLADFFTGKRVGLSCATINKLTYSGGAVFPSVLTELPGMEVDYILYHSNSVPNKLSAQETSRFLVDFANQVQQVNLVSKNIRLIGGSVDVNYSDNTQLFFKNYTEAINYITTVLKVTVRFN